MQLGFVSAILPELSLEDIFETAAFTDYGCVEIMCWPKGKAERRYAGVTHIDVAGFTKADAAQVHELTARYGVAISGLGYYPNPLAPDADEAKTYTDHLKEVIKAAEKLKIPVVNTFIGRDWTKTLEENWPRFLKTWKPLIKFAEDHGRKIAIENCPMLFHQRRMAGRQESGPQPRHLAAHVQRHPQRQLRPQL
jgi:sugar phosphate isomerase/epimerase